MNKITIQITGTHEVNMFVPDVMSELSKDAYIARMEEALKRAISLDGDKVTVVLPIEWIEQRSIGKIGTDLRGIIRWGVFDNDENA